MNSGSRAPPYGFPWIFHVFPRSVVIHAWAALVWCRYNLKHRLKGDARGHHGSSVPVSVKRTCRNSQEFLTFSNSIHRWSSQKHGDCHDWLNLCFLGPRISGRNLGLPSWICYKLRSRLEKSAIELNLRITHSFQKMNKINHWYTIHLHGFVCK